MGKLVLLPMLTDLIFHLGTWIHYYISHSKQGGLLLLAASLKHKGDLYEQFAVQMKRGQPGNDCE